MVGVKVIVGVNVIVGVFVIVGVKVDVGVDVCVGVKVIVGRDAAIDAMLVLDPNIHWTSISRNKIKREMPFWGASILDR